MRRRGTRLSELAAVVVAFSMVTYGLSVVALPAGATVTAAVVDTPHADVSEAVTRPEAAQYAKSEGHRVEVMGERSETNSTFANPDGSWTLEASTQPRRVLKGGVWQDVDTTLVADATGVHPRQAADSLAFSTGGNTSLVSLSDGAATTGMKWAGVLPVPTLHGNTATYPNVVAGVDLALTANTLGFEASIVLKAKPANLSAVYRLPLISHGLTAAGPDAAGVITLSDSVGHSAGFMRPTTMFDGQTEPLTGEPSHTGSITTTVVETGSSQELDFSPQAGFLSDPATVYPVTIDPTVHLGESNDTWIGDGGTAGSGSDELRVGYYNGNLQTHRSFVRFDTSTLTGTVVSVATLALYEWSTPAGCVPKESRIYGLAGPFSDSTTWSTQPTAYPTLYAATTDVYGATGCASNWVRYDVAALAQKWANGSYPDYGLLVRAGSETGGSTTGWWRFRGMSSSLSSQVPSLAVTYNTPPATPAVVSTAPSTPCVTGTGRPFVNTSTPRLSAVLSDRDGGTVTGQFAVTTTTGGAVSAGNAAAVASGQTGSWAVPAGALSNGSSYSWTVKGSDGSLASPASTACQFTVDTAAPVAPTATSSSFAANSWSAHGASGSWTLADTSTDVAQYQWRIGGGSWSAWSGAAATAAMTPDDGLHTLQVQAKDGAGNLSPLTTIAFGTGAGLSSPHDDSQTVQYSLLQSGAPADHPYATYLYRPGTTGTFITVPTATSPCPVTTPSTPAGR